ncbi:thioesterase II family protein [Amycolatopsis magusensis]|uniref:thioesterase II family protein n=1 Tax=Amycolatopsis magusensis TaxID=882444 RepID=UPI0024A8FD6A|nr:alpha/beta fold hydrolase [Amycolatopsis magusensis]MDI5978867.1 alpha/beta fold hydrolase [Amycolatopsis magusensis]
MNSETVREHARWLRVARPNPAAELRLFCLPYGGGGTAVFREWGAGLPDSIEVAAVRLPGRESRMGEPPIAEMSHLLPELATALIHLMDRPFAFFGHSMGARVAFELARHLRRTGAPGPAHLFVSGCPAAQLPPRPPLHALPREELVHRLREMGGVEPEVFELPGLLDVLLPVLRADFAVVETFPYTAMPPLPCSITGFAGNGDPEATGAEVAAWRTQTVADFSLHEFTGGHFFVHERLPELLRVISGTLRATRRS